VKATDSPLTQGLGSSFDVEDEPYFIELQEPGSMQILLTADYGASGMSPTVGPLYGSDTSLQSDGTTRVIGYTRQVGQGGVAYFALGHCHSPAIRAGRTADPADTTPPTFRGSWESDAFIALLRNAIAWGVAA
jgi:type 1 glutamine amidotransferase